MSDQRPAAFFDLDRTLVRTTSMQVFQTHLADAGLTDRGGGALGRLFYRAFDRTGENALLVQLGRLGPRAAQGWSVDGVAEAGEAAAIDLEQALLPFAAEIFAQHRAAGRALVLATAAPRAVAEPLARRLGFDHVVATGWAVDGKVYNGKGDGPMMWGRAKANGVRALAETHDLDLTASFAYSDSFFDVPMLDLVGTPVAVNPDLRLAALATLRRWEIRHLDKPAGVVKIGGRELQDYTRAFARPELVPNARIELVGIERIPAEGGAIVVANHRSYFDATVLSLLIARSGRNGRYLGKKEVFDVPVLGDLALAVGGIRVDRGTGSEEPLDAAIAALEAGEIVTMMPQGTIPRGPAFFDPELRGRWGAARMAAAARVPVIPVGLWGTEQVWPRSSRLPRLRVDDPPLVTACVGEPVDLLYRSAAADTKRIMAAISALLPDDARLPRHPTADDLARTYPPGYAARGQDEYARRPGTDTES